MVVREEGVGHIAARERCDQMYTMCWFVCFGTVLSSSQERLDAVVALS